jgi:hypothetical protein
VRFVRFNRFKRFSEERKSWRFGMAMPPFADPANLQVEPVPELPDGIMALELLQLAYRGRLG